MMEDTIAAVATAPGESGIGIIRISGEAAGKVLRTVFKPAHPEKMENRKMSYGHILDPNTGAVIDEVLCVFMKGPLTYTAEDTAEINCHGGMIPLRKTLELVLRSGARLAEPGEFTKRAFLNGRLDLSQAEAVIDVIRAKTDRTFDVAIKQLEGVFSEKIREIRAMLMDILVNMTVNIDYPDEDIEEMTYENLKNDLQEIDEQIAALLRGASTGRILRDGLNVAIIGKPNVGKSSLMNCLLREARAIVTEIPGTTRDTIEENLSIQGIPVKLTDTAGIRETEDQIEKIGIEKSKRSFNAADLIIFILDSSQKLSAEDREIMELLKEKKAVVLLNKTDLGAALSAAELQKHLPEAAIIGTSMKTGDGLEKLEEKIAEMVCQGQVSQRDSVLVTSARHQHLLEQAQTSVRDALQMTEHGEALELIEIDVNSCYQSLGEIIGEAVQGDIINEVFSRFCLGK